MLSDKIIGYEFGDFQLNLANRRLSRKGEIVRLTYKSCEVLLFLIKNREKVVGMHEILHECWDEPHVEMDALVQHIYRIRSALKAGGKGDTYVKTIPRQGYQFIAEVNLIPKDTTFNKPKDLIDVETPDHVRQITQIRKGKRYWHFVAVPFILLLLAVGGYFLTNRFSQIDRSTIKSIAVLPFEQIGGRKDEKLGLGVADTLISRLSNQDKVLVLPTNTIIRYVDEGYENAIEIGEKLGVDAVLTGTIQRENEIIRINVQLIGIKDKEAIWVNKFDEKFSDIFTLQDNISRQVSKQLFFDMEDAQDSSPSKQTINIEAYQSYSMGLFHWGKRNKKALAKAIQYFQDAVNKDPQFAAAYALLSDTYSLIAYHKYDLYTKKVAMNKAKIYADKALELDSNSAEAMTTLAFLSFLENDSAKARTFLNKAIKLKSNHATAIQRLAAISASEGKLSEAIDYATTAQRIDPQSFIRSMNLVHYFSLARKKDEALNAANRAVEIDPESKDAQIFLASVYEQREEYDKAIKILTLLLEKDSGSSGALSVLARIYAKTDNSEKSRMILQNLAKPRGSERRDAELLYRRALIYLHLNERGEALKILKKVEFDPPYLLNLKRDYNLDLLRDNDEFKQLIGVVEKKVRQ